MRLVGLLLGLFACIPIEYLVRSSDRATAVVCLPVDGGWMLVYCLGRRRLSSAHKVLSLLLFESCRVMFRITILWQPTSDLKVSCVNIKLLRTAIAR